MAPVQHCQRVRSPDAPIGKGTSHGPAQLGRTPGRIAAPAAGFIVALQLPGDREARYVEPVSTRLSRRSLWAGRAPPALHALAGDRARHDAAGRDAWQARGMLPGGIPNPVEPCSPSPPPAKVSRLLDEADLHDIRTPFQVHLAYACGSSRPVVERIMASLLHRGAARLTSNGHRGAIVHTGRAVMAHHAATLVRLQEDRLSKRARLFRRRRRWRCRQVNHCQASIHS